MCASCRAADGDRLSLVPSRLSSSRPETSDGVEVLRAVETLLLRHGEEQLERAVGDLRSSATAIAAATPIPLSAPSVVPVGDDPVAVENEVDPSGARVVRAVRIALAHHVQMRLEDDGRRVSTTGRSRHPHHDVALPRRPRSRSRARVAQREHVLASCGLFLRWARDPRELRKRPQTPAARDPRGRSSPQASAPRRRTAGASPRPRPADRDPLDAEPAVAVDHGRERELGGDQHRGRRDDADARPRDRDREDDERAHDAAEQHPLRRAERVADTAERARTTSSTVSATSAPMSEAVATASSSRPGRRAVPAPRSAPPRRSPRRTRAWRRLRSSSSRDAIRSPRPRRREST